MQNISQLGKKHSAAFLLPPPLSSSTDCSDQGWILEGAEQLQPGAQLLAEPLCQAKSWIGTLSFII